MSIGSKNIPKEKTSKTLDKFPESGAKVVYGENGKWVDGVEYVKKKYMV